MSPRTRLKLMAADPEALDSRAIMASVNEPGLTLGELLAGQAVLAAEPLTDKHLRVPVQDLNLDFTRLQPDRSGYPLPGSLLSAAGTAGPAGPDQVAPGEPVSAPVTPDLENDERAGIDPDFDLGRHPESITDREAVILAYREEIERASSYLESRLSVLIRCDKVLVSHLSAEIAVRSGIPARVLRADAAATPSAAPLPGLAPSRRSAVLDQFLAAIAAAKPGELIVVPHLDLLAGGTDTALTAEARELTDAVYDQAKCVLLGFIDPSLSLPEVLASRFDVRLPIEILPREVRTSAGVAPVGRALVTRQEADLFGGFDEIGLYKHIAGLNAIRLRHGLRFAAHQHGPGTPGGAAPAGTEDERSSPRFRQLVGELQTFKAKTSGSFDVPHVEFTSIGGYQDVKNELKAAISIINGINNVPEHLRTELVPAGFIFHGPPGTGKTQFAKAVATRLGATIQVVSGPEITDKYVGESERKIRELFAEARRNAPSVVVFDEFDSIAVRRSGGSDGGSRAGNAIVAQLLTELDGFRPEVPVLIIGTTNRLDLIDEALLRPSRFRPVQIALPVKADRRAIAERHARHFGVPVTDQLLEEIAVATEQFSGDDIRSLFRDARADQIVKGTVPDAGRLGQLVGELRHARQERDARRGAGTAAPAGSGGRRARLSEREMGGVVLRIRNRAGAPEDATVAGRTAP